MRNPTYYLAIFGNPDPPRKDVVESGSYHLGGRGTAIPGERGDIMLLYCTGAYAEHPLSSPGVGIILTKTSDSIYYRYLPFARPLSKDDIENTFTDEDRKKFSNIRSDSHWLIEISGESFRNATGNIPVRWP